jgi:hypothetical protein
MSIFNMDFRFFGLTKKSIDEASIRDYLGRDRATRICFGTTHSEALKPTSDGGDVKAWLNLPFADTIKVMLERKVGNGVTLYEKKNGNGYCFPAKNKETVSAIEDFIKKYQDMVFLCDNLDMSVAISMHETEPGKRTAIGESEYQVKYNSDKKDTSSERAMLLDKLQTALDDLPYYKSADYICAIPSSRTFVKEMIADLEGWDGKDISDKVSWDSKNKDLKNIDSTEEKMKALQGFGLTFDDIDLKDKAVVLVDDMYKSGLTMQFVAMKLKEAKVKYVFGICLVKALGND